MFNSQTRLNIDKVENITEIYHPKYRKGDFNHMIIKRRGKSNQNQEEEEQKIKIQGNIVGPNLMNSYIKINASINNLISMFQTRMELHESQIIKIVQSQIKKIKAECDATVNKYNQLIRQKNVNSQIQYLRYEVRYYQIKACEINEQNKKLRNDIKRLKNEIEEFKIGWECGHSALRNVSKKYIKERLARQRLEIGFGSTNKKMYPKTLKLDSLNPEYRSLQKDLTEKANKMYTPLPLTGEIKFITENNDLSEHKKTEFDKSLLKIKKKIKIDRINTEPTREYSFVL